jgi:hypothetical protein
MKATSGYVFTLAGGAVTWRSSKQTILTRSTVEAELVALDSVVVEAEWIQNLLSDLPIMDKPVPPVLTYCDNQTVLVKVKSRKENMKSSEHIKRRLKSARHALEVGIITVDYICSEENLADLFTKGLARTVIQAASKRMGLLPTDKTHIDSNLS